MSNRVEIFVSIVDRVGKPGFQAGAASAVHDQFNTDKKGFSLIVQGAQTSTAVASVLSVTQMTAGAVPFINIVTNSLAGTVTFLKIVAEYRDNQKLNYGDVVSLVGNVAGVVAGFALLLGGPLTAGSFTAVSLAASLIGTYNSELARRIQKTATDAIINALKTHDVTQEPSTPLIAPNLTVTDPASIASHFGGLITVITWNPTTHDIKLDTRILEGFKTNASTQPIPHGGNNLPVTPPAPEHSGGATLTIGIESLTGQPPAGPTPSITVGFGAGQDKYACCNAPQQDKYR
ncbi:TPA: hypothetical protein U8203_002349 [Pseudomonas putida]|nr:hypothetical protein [Pseudomonas putida]HEN8717051.1 hypothetical protein [Pseudomonas putida]